MKLQPNSANLKSLYCYLSCKVIYSYPYNRKSGVGQTCDFLSLPFTWYMTTHSYCEKRVWKLRNPLYFYYNSSPLELVAYQLRPITGRFAFQEGATLGDLTKGLVGEPDDVVDPSP